MADNLREILDEQFCIHLRELTDITEGAMDCFKDQALSEILAMLPEKRIIKQDGSDQDKLDFGWNAYDDEIRKRLGVEDDTTR